MASTVIRPFLMNRNPRNLERLRYAQKALGYQLEKDAELKSFYYKVNYQPSERHTVAAITHYKDGDILSVSTKEPALKARIHSGSDVATSENVGRILAHRCLKAGIYFVKKHISDQELATASERVKAFYLGMEDGGLKLNEENMIEPDWTMDKRYHFRVPEQEQMAEQARQLDYTTAQSLHDKHEDSDKYKPLD